MSIGYRDVPTVAFKDVLLHGCNLDDEASNHAVDNRYIDVHKAVRHFVCIMSVYFIVLAYQHIIGHVIQTATYSETSGVADITFALCKMSDKEFRLDGLLAVKSFTLTEVSRS